MEKICSPTILSAALTSGTLVNSQLMNFQSLACWRARVSPILVGPLQTRQRGGLYIESCVRSAFEVSVSGANHAVSEIGALPRSHA
ncbi:MAG: hypothetical protein KA271_07120 [Propionivibrio sp.]|nr:hypothetical protein [Propionivibrio sp.]